MMVIDTLALIAILSNEPERRAFNERIEAASRTSISAATLLEARIVLVSRFGDRAVLALDAFLLRSGATIVDVSPRIADMAFDAFRRFGKGTGHGAALNYGDCFSYALARRLGAPLLFKGDDFSQTDIQSAGARGDDRAGASGSDGRNLP